MKRNIWMYLLAEQERCQGLVWSNFKVRSVNQRHMDKWLVFLKSDMRLILKALIKTLYILYFIV